MHDQTGEYELELMSVEVDYVARKLDPLLKLWTLVSDYQKHATSWLKSPFFSLDPQEIEKQVNP